jgi:hypothetical protein
VNLPTSDAVDRLDASRHQLQRALRMATREPSAEADLTADVVRGWWVRHPWRVGSEAALGVADALLRPVAQRHPLRLVAGAVLVGGLLAWSRPWRWAARPGGLVTGLCRQLVHEAVARRWPQGLVSKGPKPL